MRSYRVYLLSLGCAKNQVDSEIMSGALKRDRFIVTDRCEDADVIIVNTCGFIEAAKKESIAALLELAAYKEIGRCKILAAVGCMAEKYASEMAEAMPEIDLVVGSHDYARIGQLVAEKLGLPLVNAEAEADYQIRDLEEIQATAYLKIAEGCSTCCSYCLIPQLRGPYISRPEEDILAEAAMLAEKGVEELVVIAQDTAWYGLDLYGENRLAGLLDRLAALPFSMIRILYAYPDRIDDAVLEVMQKHQNICRYLDIPIQHASNHILKDMNRNCTERQLRDTIKNIRRFLPDVSLRTTVMVGFPGETEEDFQTLLDFVRDMRFDWLGCFMYSQEEDTPAAAMPNQIDEEVKQERYDAVMQLAATVTEERIARFRGKILPVILEGIDMDDPEFTYYGRSQYQAPAHP